MRRSKIPCLVFILLVAFVPTRAVALDVLRVALFKAQVYSQTGATTPALAASNSHAFGAEVAPLIVNWVSNPSVRPPSGSVRSLVLDESSAAFEFTSQFNSASALDAAFPQGAYTFAYSGVNDGAATETVTLGADAYPPIPQLSNYTQAQTIQPTTEFTLSWTPWAGATENDVLSVEVYDSGGNVVQNSDSIFGLAPLPGTTTSYTLQPGTLQAGQSYNAIVTFARLTVRSVDDIPQKLVAFVRMTGVTIKAASGSSGGGGEVSTPDGQAPTLTTSFPADGTTGALAQQGLLLAFSEPMRRQQSIEWSSNIDPSKVNYAWSGNSVLNVSYTGGWPAGAVVTWRLNPSPGGAQNFKDTSGMELATVSGSFTIAGSGGGTGGPCDGTDPIRSSGFALLKQLAFFQGGEEPPVPEGPNSATFFAYYQGPAVPLISVEYPPPPAVPRKLKQGQSLGGLFQSVQATFPDRTALDAEFPPGEFAFQLRQTADSITSSVNLRLLASDYPSTPRIANFTALQSANASGAVTVRWDPFVGAIPVRDFLTVTVMDSQGRTVFQAPDPCKNIQLAVTATSVNIPSGVLSAGQTYDLELGFFRQAETNKVLAGVNGISGASARTKTTLKTGGATPAQPARFTGIREVSPQTVQLDLTCTAGVPLVIESINRIGGTWVTLLTTNPPTTTLSVRVPVSGTPSFIRARN